MEVDDIDTYDVLGVGALLESHERFPQKVNVGFMQIMDKHNIKLRVFERGVGETLACGSGACAAVAIGQQQGKLGSEVKRIFNVSSSFRYCSCLPFLILYNGGCAI